MSAAYRERVGKLAKTRCIPNPINVVTFCGDSVTVTICWSVMQNYETVGKSLRQ